jgi:hypothetical protein
MGGAKDTKTACAVLVALALALGGPASAVAEGPLDAAALQAVQQQAAAVVAPTAQQAGAVVQGATGGVVPAVALNPAPKPRSGHAPAAAQVASPGQAASGQASVTAPRLRLTETAPASTQAGRSVPPPHGHEALPAARSHPGRARVASSHSKLANDTSAVHGPVGEQAPGGAPLAHWKPRNPLLGLGRPVGNPAALIQIGWLLTMLAGGCIGGRILLRRLRAE